MTPEKDFDCIEYKRAIQRKHFAETRGMTSEQQAKRRQEWLRTSDNPAARAWRNLIAKQEAAASKTSVAR